MIFCAIGQSGLRSGQPEYARWGRRLLGIVALILMGLFASSAPSLAESTPEELEARFSEALTHYAQAMDEKDRDARLAGFARAEHVFSGLVAAGIDTAPLWTNLGNAALQAEHPGQAVLAYRRALLRDPDSAKAKQNLSHARTKLPSWVPRPTRADGAQSLFLIGRLAPSTRSFLAALAFAIAGLCWAVSVRRRAGPWWGLSVLSGLTFATLLGANALMGLRDDEGGAAVLTAAETPARSADSSLSPLALPEPLPAGVEVSELERRADWSRIRLANGRDVWVRASAVTRVARDPA